MRFEGADRRRLALASALTFAALPFLWLWNQREDTANPNVAAVGLPAEDAVTATGTATTIDPMGALPPLLASGENPPSDSRWAVPFAVGTAGSELLSTATATFRHAVGSPDICWYSGTANGAEVLVVNVENGRSIECVTIPHPDGADDEIVLDPDRFVNLASFTDAPVAVEIRVPK